MCAEPPAGRVSLLSSEGHLIYDQAEGREVTLTPVRHICVHAWRALWCGNLAATEAPWHNLHILVLTITLGFLRGTAIK